VNPVRVDYYRRVRDCVPNLDHAELRRKLESLLVLAKQLDEQLSTFRQATSDFVRMHIAHVPHDVELAFW
jgi:hypothetical protein